MFNPAKAGESGTRVFYLNRQQWKDIAGAPETSVLSLDHKISDKNVGLGILVLSDSDNFFNRTFISGTYNYTLKLGEMHFISFALSPGVIYSQIDFTKIRTDEIDDPLIFSNIQNSTGFTCDAGLNYKFKNLNFGLIANQITSSKLYYQSPIDGNYVNYQLIQHFAGHLSYAFKFGADKYVVEPGILGRSTIGLPLQVEAGVNFNYDNVILSRIGYRSNSNIYMAVAFNLYNDLTVGCGYEYSLGQISGYSGSTYEIIVGYRIGKRKDQSVSTKTDKQANKTIVQNIENQSQKIDEIIYKNQELKKEIDENHNDITKLKEEIEQLKNNSKLSDEDLKMLMEIKQKYEVVSDSENEKPSDKNNINSNFDTKSNTNNNVNENRDSTTSAIDESEINATYCVIIGAYTNLETAKQGQKILLRELNLKTTIIMDESNYFYFICSNSFDTKEEVVLEKERLKLLNVEQYIIGKPWTYKLVRK
jgi:type IX secretion system PorP/SprF family membrane protein